MAGYGEGGRKNDVPWQKVEIDKYRCKKLIIHTYKVNDSLNI